MKNSSCLFSTYINTINGVEYGLFGPYNNFQSYLASKYSHLVIIKQPMPGEEDLTVYAEVYINKKLKKTIKFPKIFTFIFADHFKKLHSNKTSIRLKFRDYFSTIYFGIKGSNSKPYSVMIGLESINTIAGYSLKKLNYVTKLVYFANDWHPSRYPSVLNLVFLWLDKFCSYKSDRLWLMNMNIHKSRLLLGYKEDKMNLPDSIHGGLPFFTNNYNKPTDRNKYSLIYASRETKQGADLVIPAFNQIKRRFDGAVMYMTGNCSEKNLSGFNLDGIVFTGFLSEINLNKLISNSWVGVAVWKSDIIGVSATYGDPEKIRRYLHYGIPVVVTKNAYTSLIIEENNAGIVCNSKEDDLVEAISKLFNDYNFYLKASENALVIGNKYQNNNPIDKAIDLIMK